MASFEELSTGNGTGWPLDIFTEARTLRRRVLRCGRPDCAGILKDPWQLDCGHRYCRSCLDIIAAMPITEQYCAPCVEDLNYDDATTEDAPTLRPELREIAKIDIAKAFKDNPATKEIGRLAVRCPNGCEETRNKTLKLKDLGVHLGKCPNRKVKCSKCGEEMLFSNRLVHETDDCLCRVVSCPNKCGVTGILFKDLNAHASTCEMKPFTCTFCHHVIETNMAAHLQTCTAQCPLEGCQVKHSAVLTTHLSAHWESHIYLIMQLLASIRTESPDDKEFVMLVGRVLQCERRSDLLSDRVQKVFVDSGYSPEAAQQIMQQCLVSYQNRQHLEEVQQVSLALGSDVELLSSCTDVYTELQKKTIQQEGNVSDRLSVIEAAQQQRDTDSHTCAITAHHMKTPYINGRLIWRLDEVLAMREAAVTNPCPETLTKFSPEFYSKPYGFKMRLKLYIDGDGTARGRHMSLFIIILKGDYDQMLSWPFSHRVTFRLRNQLKSKSDIEESFVGDVNSESFQRPSGDSNPPSGVREFAEITYALAPESGFLVDDAMFIEAVVKPSDGNTADSVSPSHHVQSMEM